MRQKGFTLVEVLVVLAVSGVLLTGLITSIFQVSTFTDRSNSQVVALTDLNHAALSIKKDLMMTQNTDLADGSPVPQSSVWLGWTDYTSFETGNLTHSSSYVLSGTELLRTYDGTVGIAGRNITSLGFTKNGRVIDVVITATGSSDPQRSETLKFSVLIRTEGLE